MTCAKNIHFSLAVYDRNLNLLCLHKKLLSELRFFVFVLIWMCKEPSKKLKAISYDFMLTWTLSLLRNVFWSNFPLLLLLPLNSSWRTLHSLLLMLIERVWGHAYLPHLGAPIHFQGRLNFQRFPPIHTVHIFTLSLCVFVHTCRFFKKYPTWI